MYIPWKSKTVVLTVFTERLFLVRKDSRGIYIAYVTCVHAGAQHLLVWHEEHSRDFFHTLVNLIRHHHYFELRYYRSLFTCSECLKEFLSHLAHVSQHLACNSYILGPVMCWSGILIYWMYMISWCSLCRWLHYGQVSAYKVMKVMIPIVVYWFGQVCLDDFRCVAANHETKEGTA